MSTKSASENEAEELLKNADRIAEEETAKQEKELQEKLASRPGELAESREYLPGEGPVEFFSEDGRFFLGQGEVAVDITDYLHTVNYPMGRIVLSIRMTNHKKVVSGNKAWNWMIESMRSRDKDKSDKHGYEYPEDGE